MLDGNRLTFTGLASSHGVTTVTRTNFGKSDLTLSIQTATESQQIIGTLSSTDWVAQVVADIFVWSATNRAMDFAAKYTMVIPGYTNAAVAPAGDGYGVLKVSSLGKVKLTGSVADGQTISQSTIPLSKFGNWPLYVPLYLGSGFGGKKEFKGSIIGWLNFNGDNHAPTGTLSWIKTSFTNGFYNDGFSNSVDVLSSVFVPQPKGTRAVAITNGTVACQDGNLTSPFTNTFFLKAHNSFLFDLPNVNSEKLRLNAKSGLIGGSFMRPENAKKRTIIKGVVLQDQNIGRGFFLGTNQSGSVRLEGN